MSVAMGQRRPAAYEHTLDRFGQKPRVNQVSQGVLTYIDGKAEKATYLLTGEADFGHFHVNHLNLRAHIVRDIRNPHGWVLRAHPHSVLTPEHQQPNARFVQI